MLIWEGPTGLAKLERRPRGLVEGKPRKGSVESEVGGVLSRGRWHSAGLREGEDFGGQK